MPNDADHVSSHSDLASQDAQAAKLEDAKSEEIDIACASKDIAALARLSATRGGFLSDDLRSKACMSLSKRADRRVALIHGM